MIKGCNAGNTTSPFTPYTLDALSLSLRCVASRGCCARVATLLFTTWPPSSLYANVTTHPRRRPATLWVPVRRVASRGCCARVASLMFTTCPLSSPYANVTTHPRRRLCRMMGPDTACRVAMWLRSCSHASVHHVTPMPSSLKHHDTPRSLPPVT